MTQPTPTRGLKAKTINKILTGKFISWTRSITDETTRKLVEKNTIITGGAIVSMLLNEEINDFDIYFRDHATALAVAEYYVKKLQANPPAAFVATKDKIRAVFEPAVEAVEGHPAMPARVRILVNSRGLRGEEMQANQDAAKEAAKEVDFQFAAGQVGDTSEPEQLSYEDAVTQLDEQPAAKVTVDQDEKKRGKYRVMFMTANAITLSDQIQIVLRFAGAPEEIHTNFDFVHVLNYWTSWNREVVFNVESLLAISARELRYQGSKFPICSVIRTRKFITRGWTINAGQYVKMAYQIAQLDMNDPEVLEEQLVGVDSAYFSQLIAQLKEQPDPTRVEGNHLLTLIDKIFN